MIYDQWNDAELCFGWLFTAQPQLRHLRPVDCVLYSQEAANAVVGILYRMQSSMRYHSAA